MEKTTRCHRCGRTFTYGTWAIGCSDSASEDEACGLCRKPVCSGCAHTWGQESDAVHKVCEGCMRAHDMRRDRYSTEELAALRSLTGFLVFSYACPVCKRSTSPREVFKRYVFCTGCRKLVCPTDCPPGPLPRCSACVAAAQCLEAEGRQASRAATTTCERCGATVPGVGRWPAVCARGTVQCQGCAKWVCGRCMRLMKIMWSGTFPCCLDCVPKMSATKNVRALPVIRDKFH